ncbi:unnamed protein product [Trichobilharzia regenti]|nr:unnamed protein product [Trichobilharzia regenti]
MYTALFAFSNVILLSLLSSSSSLTQMTLAGTFAEYYFSRLDQKSITKLKKSDNPIAKFFIKCLCCCFWLLETFLRFLNRNAFIMVSVFFSLLPVASKIVTAVLLHKLCKIREGLIREKQAGFRSDCGCIDHVFTLRQLLEPLHTCCRSTIFVFLDIRAVFDSLDKNFC